MTALILDSVLAWHAAPDVGKGQGRGIPVMRATPSVPAVPLPAEPSSSAP